MAQFPALQFTKQGLQMLIQAQNTHTLTFTCGKLGSGTLEDDDNMETFTDLKAPKMTLPITDVDDSKPEKLVLTFDVSNTELEKGFISRELGVFAKLDDGAEMLYAYSNAGNNYDYIPGKDTPSDENRIVVNLVVNSSANISVTIDSSIVYVHKSDVEKMISEHDNDADAHKSLALTINDTLAPTADKNTLTNLLSNLANMFTKVTGQDSWMKEPTASIASILSNLQNNLAVNWNGSKFTVPALGISGLMAQNGYVNFGKLMGGLIIQWGSNVLNLNGITQEISLPLKIKYAAAAVVTMRSNDFANFVACPYWSECTQTTIKITPDYETGQGYAGTAQATVTWVLISI